MAQRGHLIPEAPDLRQPQLIGDHSGRAGIDQPVDQRLLGKEREERHRNHAGLVDCRMGKSSFRTLRQQDRHPVPALDTAGRQHIREPAGGFRDIAETVAVDRPLFGPVDQRRGVRLLPVRDIAADIVALRNAPFEGVADPVVSAAIRKHFLSSLPKESGQEARGEKDHGMRRPASGKPVGRLL